MNLDCNEFETNAKLAFITDRMVIVTSTVYQVIAKCVINYFTATHFTTAN